MWQPIGGRLVALAALFLATAIVGLSPAVADPQGSRWGADYFPNVPLVTQDGQTVHFYEDLLKGKAVAINLIYTHCKDACPLETARLVQVQRLLGDRVGREIFFYSISIDPARDTPAVLKAYTKKFHVGPGWLFLTGKKADIDLLSKKLGLSSRTDADSPDGHQTSLMLGHEPTGQWMRHSAEDNSRFLAVAIENLLGKSRQPRKSYAEARPLTVDEGQHLFQMRCAACHSIGKGDGVGPDLLGVTRRRDRTWLTRMIATPDTLLAEGDPLATTLFNTYKQVRMPNLGLTEAQVGLLIEYLEAQGATRQRPESRDSVIAQ